MLVRGGVNAVRITVDENKGKLMLESNSQLVLRAASVIVHHPENWLVDSSFLPFSGVQIHKGSSSTR